MADAIEPEELRDRIDAGEEFSLVDTRDDESFERWHVEGALQYPFKPGDAFDADDFRERTKLAPDDEIVTICAKGISSYEFADELAAAGFESVTVVEDGMEGWSRVYDVATVPTDGDVEIVQFQRRAKGCLSYLVADTNTDVAAVVDPTRHVETFVEVAADRGWEITHVFDTHVHADHISGGRSLADEVGARYHLGENATDRDVRYEYEPLARNGVVDVGSLAVKAIETPGHTSEFVSYLVGGTAILTGDTLFVDSVGRTELQFGEGDATDGARQLYQSIHGSLLVQPEGVTVLPGHFSLASDGTASITHGEPVSAPVRTVRTELPLLQFDESGFVDNITSSLPEQPANYESIIAINAGKDRPGDETEAAELETGPNNCAATSD